MTSCRNFIGLGLASVRVGFTILSRTQRRARRSPRPPISLQSTGRESRPRSAWASTAGTCPAPAERKEVNATLLESDPSNARLQEFVRCAAMELEANGYFGIGALSSHPRWRNQSIYLFGLDTNGTPLFSGNFYSQSWWGGLTPELSDQIDGPFEGRDVVSVGDSFGETILYYPARNPFTG